MHDSVLKDWLDSTPLAGANASYLEQLYETYLQDPDAVEACWRDYFADLPAPTRPEEPHSPIKERFRQLALAGHARRATMEVKTDARQIQVLQLINSYRVAGHELADLDPLGLWQQTPRPELGLSYYQLTEADLDCTFHVGTYLGCPQEVPLRQLLTSLQRTYCGSIGAEYMHMTSLEEKRWIQQRLEPTEGQIELSAQCQRQILDDLTGAEGLERFLGAKFPGAKRFSLEGGDMLIPMVKELIRHAGEEGCKEVVIGMAHRGRLNMLINVLGKKSQELFDEFAGKHGESWGTGDVKYHQGFSADFATAGGNVHLALAFNPSHLEIVNPVVIGSVRARMDRLGDKSGKLVLPITIHGDSAIAGQGVVAESLNMSQTRAFGVGGAVRIVINNQIGFTTSNPKDTRSSAYCTDVAKMVQAPIFHVNGDDPEAVIRVTRLALDFRNTFHRDVFIDLVCYRRNGHNEADEPTATQPIMYQKIKVHPTARQRYGERLVARGLLSEDEPEQMVQAYRDALEKGACVVKEWQPMSQQYQMNWTPFLGHDWDIQYDSSYPLEALQQLGESLTRYPANFPLQRQVGKIYDDRLAMSRGERPVDWGFAETLAYATLVKQGFRVRLTGQDSGRGTFFHRHAVLHNQDDASLYIPLRHVDDKQAPFEVYDSVLSEEAVLAFEYGYATAAPAGLTIWEAQFGDFANGAQVVIDQFVSSGEQKWGRLCGLTLFLPHGYEGQGPEHSSARPERYLQLCAQHNMQICMPTTPAQVYHMLRRQMIRPMRRPLIVFTPKSLLRHPQAISTLDELANGRFQNVIGEQETLDPAQVRRVVLCSGKVYYDLLEARRKAEQKQVALIRIEQLYPFPHAELAEVLKEYQQVRDFVWCQEEPQNQGAWYCSQHHFWEAIPSGARLRYVGRPASASPAVGYISLHMKQQKALVEDALTLE
ncbi:2-oxoglutarate dehydrogenase E1 component [Pseudaeromonas paramecii]|uniref:oxoglutarate dehydrogenase (succinyl-transferring) n=1 Tax=Pseudaeromonas paramecii TaxID=2138166 RepID=A0ABP8Q5G7_9GAMM